MMNTYLGLYGIMTDTGSDCPFPIGVSLRLFLTRTRKRYRSNIQKYVNIVTGASDRKS